MKSYTLSGQTIQAADCVDGVFVDPALPSNFDDTDNQQRPESHQLWWDVPFVRSYRPTAPDPGFLQAWPSGVRYDTRCLDGGAWDRSTFWGAFATLGEAVGCAHVGPAWRCATHA